ncbi:M48 family metallopeptidase [Candidatus Omnitrophota bacterium]
MKCSKRYSAIKTRIFVADLVVTAVSLAVFQIFLSRPVSLAAFNICSNFYAACFVFAGIFLVFVYVVGLPLQIINSFLVEYRFGLSRQSFGAWLADEAKSTALSFALAIISIQVFYFVLRNFPSVWWVIVSAVWIFFSVVLARLLPVVLIPVFFKYIPIEDRLLKERIMLLANKAGVPLMDVCQIDFSRKTAKANAALVGLGKTRKVILADTLTEKFTPKEVEAVVAHEFGHLRYKHIWQLLAFSGVMTTAGFFILSLIAKKVVVLTGAGALSDPYLLPVLVFMMAAFGIILLPAQNLFSRILERQADTFALELTDEPEEFISVMRKLSEMNLADAEPSRMKKIFLYSHPPIGERIRMAEKIKHGGVLN